jgi:NTP pyrophosphatase (non-canonical NTP hydrolase)
METPRDTAAPCPFVLPKVMYNPFTGNLPENIRIYEEAFMNFNDYQTRSRVTAKYPAIGHAVIYPTLGLVNEAGEVAGKIKKVFRDKNGEISAETREALKAELGDVLWYLAQTCTELELSLDEVAESNLTKLLDRQARGKINGDGDNR